MLDTCNKWVKLLKHLWIIGYGTEVSAKGKLIIQKLIKNENIDLESSGLSKKWNELIETFKINNKIIK